MRFEIKKYEIETKEINMTIASFLIGNYKKPESHHK